MALLRILLSSPWESYVETARAILSSDFSIADADALLSVWSPCERLFRFSGRKAWYCCEPACQFEAIDRGRWVQLRRRLAPSEFLYHGHPDIRFRVPHVTHFESLRMNRSEERLPRAIAIVSNHGGGPLRRHRDLTFRNQLVTSGNVDLFGRSSWKFYRATLFSRCGAPKNYLGELEGDWPGGKKRDLMSKYKVCVCLENMNEFGYFTEKFVEAAAAGCIPVYRASADVRDSVLKGACWFDPADSRWRGEAAIEAALDADLRQVQEQNLEWLNNSPELSSTHSARVFERLVDSLFPAE